MLTTRYEYAIEVEGLSKTYAYHHKEPGLRGSLRSLFRRRILERRAVDGISFRIETGEVVGFLGPNGAGKTTTLKMLSGLLYLTSGHAEVLGHTPSRREPEYLRQIALVMGQKSMLWWDIPAMETLLLHKEMYDLPDKEFRATVRELGEMLDVGHLLGVQVRKLSLGERMKMELLVALVHRPKVLFLDEPTIGLDVVSQQRVREFLSELNRREGTTVLLTSHYMDDVEALCPRVLVIDQGRIHFDGALTELVESTAPEKLVTVVFAQPVPGDELAAALGGVELIPTEDPLRVRLSVPRERVAGVTAGIVRLGGVADLTIQDVPVEEIVRRVFTASGREVAG